VEIRIADAGEGLSTEDLPHVFDHCWRGGRSCTRETRGLSLGLTITKQLVLAQGVTISAESAQGLGSSFSVNLRVASDSV